jgi:hypothetical protein
MAELSYSEISKLLKYEPETGKLFWLPRPLEMFQGRQPGGPSAGATNWNNRYAGKEVASYTKGYIIARIQQKHYAAHRLAWLLHYGEWPRNHIDHINGCRDDNRIENLRDVTNSENHKNTRIYKHNATGHAGVHWYNKEKKWRARIGSKLLGCFRSFEEAIAARQQAEKEYGYHQNHGKL